MYLLLTTSYKSFMQRFQYYISFTLLYLIFTFVFLWVLKPRVRFVYNGVYNEKRHNRIQNFFVAAILIVISSIRMNTGSDYWSYSLIYNRALSNYHSIAEVLADRPSSPGLYVLSYVLKSISKSLNLDGVLEQNLLFIVVSVFTTVVTLTMIRKLSKDFKLSIMIYLLMGYYCIANNILKQQIAMSILLIAYDRCKQQKYVSYIILCIFACLFHITAIIPSILFPIIQRYRAKKSDIYIFIGINLLITALLPFTMRFFSNITILGYTKYFENFSTYSNATVGSTYALGCFIAYAIIFSIMYRNKDLIFESSKDTYTYIFVLSAGLIFNALALNFWLLVRVSLYFYQFVIFLIPNAIVACNPSKNTKRWIYIGLIAFCVFYILYSWDNHYFAYHTVYEENMVPAYLDTYISLYE